MRLFRVTTNYPTYLSQFYARNPTLQNQSYAVQFGSLVADGFGWADFWLHALAPLGYEVWEPIGNAEAMQKAWAKENARSYDTAGWMYDILVEQARFFGPEVVFIDDYSAYDKSFASRLRDACPSLRLIMGWCAAPYSDESVFGQFDVVLSSIPGLVRSLRAKGYRAEHLRHAFDPRVLERIAPDTTKHFDVVFAGTLGTNRTVYSGRVALLAELLGKTNLEIFSDLIPIPKDPEDPGFEAKLRRLWRGIAGDDAGKRTFRDDWNRIAASSKAARFGLEMFRSLSRAKVALNNHIDFFGDSASNMRLYEATGAGSCLLTDWKEDLHELFVVDKEVVTYRSAAECADRIRWLLAHPAEREAIARAGQARTLRDHTFANRAPRLDEVIQSSLRA